MTSDEAIAATACLVNQYRDQCLWFLKASFSPEPAEDALAALELIERYGDRSAFIRAEEIKPWLLPAISLKS